VGTKADIKQEKPPPPVKKDRGFDLTAIYQSSTKTSNGGPFMKRFLIPLVVLLAASFLFSACAPQVQTADPEPQQTAGDPIVLIDGLSRTVELDGPAQRIVSLAPSNIEILFALGAGDQVVGRDEFTNYPSEALSLPSVGGSFMQYNKEVIVDLQPDLVLAAEINSPENVQSLEELGLTVYYLSNPTDLEGMYENLRIVGKLTGKEAEAERLAASLAERATALLAKVSQVSERPVVFYELDATDPNAPYTAGPGTFIDLLINLAGGQNAAGDISSPWVQLSVEELLVINPDVILLGDYAYGVTIESVQQRAGWNEIEAVKNDRIYPFDDDLASRPGPRLVDGLEELVNLLHPDL
jgi:iron complex transport system substrate-binding protein